MPALQGRTEDHSCDDLKKMIGVIIHSILFFSKDAGKWWIDNKIGVTIRSRKCFMLQVDVEVVGPEINHGTISAG
jgi:hypothetical protein